MHRISLIILFFLMSLNSFSEEGNGLLIQIDNLPEITQGNQVTVRVRGDTGKAGIGGSTATIRFDFLNNNTENNFVFISSALESGQGNINTTNSSTGIITVENIPNASPVTVFTVTLEARGTSSNNIDFIFNAKVSDDRPAELTTSVSGNIKSPDISINTTGTSTSITAGGNGILNYIINNTGIYATAPTSTNVTFSVTLPDEFTYQNTNGSGSGWTVTPSGQTLNIQYAPVIASGASSSTLIININARSSGSSLGINHHNYADIISTPMSLGTYKEIVTTNNSISITPIGVNKVSDLSISISSNETSFVPGREYFIDVTVDNLTNNSSSVSDASSVRVRSTFPNDFILGTSEVIVVYETAGVQAGNIISYPGDNFFEIEDAIIPINGQVIYRFPIVLNYNTVSQWEINANVSSEF